MPAQASVTIIIASVPSTTITLTPVPGLAEPVAAGTKVCDIAVAPTGWNGGIELSGTDAMRMRVGGASPNYIIVANEQLGDGSYSVTARSTP